MNDGRAGVTLPLIIEHVAVDGRREALECAYTKARGEYLAAIEGGGFVADKDARIRAISKTTFEKIDGWTNQYVDVVAAFGSRERSLASIERFWRGAQRAPGWR